jgi:hypothetical protein
MVRAGQMKGKEMKGLLPIVRRIRRPLLPPDEKPVSPAVAPVAKAAGPDGAAPSEFKPQTAMARACRNEEKDAPEVPTA